MDKIINYKDKIRNYNAHVEFAIEPEREHRFIYKTLINHIVKDRNSSGNSYSRESHSEYTIKLKQIILLNNWRRYECDTCKYISYIE